MRAYQAVALVAGMMGLAHAMVFIVTNATAAVAEPPIIIDGFDSEWSLAKSVIAIVGVAPHIAGMSLPFVLKKRPMIVSCIMFGIAVPILISSWQVNVYAYITAALFVASGMLAIRWDRKSGKNPSLDNAK